MANFTRKNINTSLKNIPIPKVDTYMKALIEKTSHFVRRIRWRAFFFMLKRKKRRKRKVNNSSGSESDVSEDEGGIDPDKYGSSESRGKTRKCAGKSSKDASHTGAGKGSVMSATLRSCRS